MRIIKEFFNPSLKCKRLGCDYKTVEKKIRKRSYEYREIVTDYVANINICKRCGKIKGEPFNLKKIDYYTSCTMPTAMWDEINVKGYLIL